MNKSKILDLKVAGMRNPLGLDNDPLFSWRYETTFSSFSQTSFRFFLYDENKDLLFDSKEIKSKKSQYLYKGKLAREASFYWKVEARTNKGEFLSSELASFITGLKKTKLGQKGVPMMIESKIKPFYPSKVSCFAIDFDFEMNQAKELMFAFGNGDIRRDHLLFNPQFYEAKDCYFGIKINQEGSLFILQHHMEKDVQDKVILETKIEGFESQGTHHFHLSSWKNVVTNMTLDEKEIEGTKDFAFSIAPSYPATADDGFLGKIAFLGEGAAISNLLIKEEPAKAISYSLKDPKPFVKEGYLYQNQKIHAKSQLSFVDLGKYSLTYFRKSFSLEKPLKKAIVYATSWGIYTLSINGKKVGDEAFLKPGNDVYCASLHYNTFDVTSFLKEGRNAIGALVAPGWWSGSYLYLHYIAYWGDKVGFFAKIVLEYADGSKEEIKTDATWKTYNDGPTRFADFYDGEDYDARKEKRVEDYSLASFNDRRWKRAIKAKARLSSFEKPLLIGKDHEDAKIHRILLPDAPRKVIYKGRVAYIYDFHTNFGGLASFSLPRVKKGEKIFFRYAETLYPKKYPESQYDYGDKEGFLYTENLRGAVCIDTYISNGKAIEFTPSLTFHGFRYVEISFESLSEEDSSRIIAKTTVKGLQISSLEEECIAIKTSDEKVNKLFDNIMVTTFANHVSIPTDCPQRDERLGWTGDLQIFASTANYLSNVTPFYYSFERTLCDNAKSKANSSFGIYAPEYTYDDWGKLKYDPTAKGWPISWPLAGVAAPYYSYRQSGNKSILRSYYKTMVRFMNGYRNIVIPGYEVLTKTAKEYEGLGYGDWVSMAPTDIEYVLNAQYVYGLRMMQEIATALGKRKDAKLYQELHDTVIREFNEVFIDGNNIPQDLSAKKLETQTAYSLALDYDIVSGSRKEAFVKAYKDLIEKDNYTMTSGFLGTPSLLPALTKNGEAETAMKLFLSHGFPSWLYEVDQGAVSMWERWDCYSRVKGFQERSMNSESHYAFGAVEGWFIKDIAGIRNDIKSGFQEFNLTPTFVLGLTDIEVNYKSEYGLIQSVLHTDKEGNPLSYHCIVPPNTKATLLLPKALLSGNNEDKGRERLILESGTYHFGK